MRVGGRVGVGDVVSQFVQQTGLPESLVRDEFTITDSEIFQSVSSRSIGQDHASRVVSNIVTRFKAGLNDPSRPLGVQLFCGPTGVGKTEMAKAIADFLFSANTSSGDAGNARLVH